ncbi:hypothetical protein Pth03_28990 [Planotetraspora thailandica]|uniref:Chitinase n=1 Tax=Planotetraspora thailandica TaxID=487172 RepID=A0A8J3VC55_9ACTN|nr:hypothetical protein [Planotetraspora thailandica]GII54510.1 hypothetical protein Pth03_28990 [Planotetraspora thailandica]
MDSARHNREAGTPPRSVVLLAGTVLVIATGFALWLLPAQTRADWGSPSSPPTRSLAAAHPTPEPGTAKPSQPAPDPVATRRPPPPVSPARVRVARPSGYMGFADVARNPRFDLSAGARNTGVLWYTIGHLTAGPDGCSPTWDGTARRGDMVAERLGELRAQGGDAALSFGGPSGPELSATCEDPARLLAAYREVLDAFQPASIDFEVNDSSDTAAVERRAAAIALLQDEAGTAGRPLGVTFTLPVAEDGLDPDDVTMLRAAHDAGAEIDTVNLLMRFVPGSPDNLRRLSIGARSAHTQLAEALGVGGRPLWHRIGLTPILASADDLGLSEAQRLAAFRAKTDLAWLSARGASPADAVIHVLNTSDGS